GRADERRADRAAPDGGDGPGAAPLPRRGAGGLGGCAGAEGRGAAACGPGTRDPVDGVGRGGRDPRGLRACGCRGARRRAALAGGGGGDVADGGKCRAPRPDRLRGEVSDVVERAGSTTVVG